MSLELVLVQEEDCAGAGAAGAAAAAGAPVAAIRTVSVMVCAQNALLV
jgi:hypothetical protein